MKIEMAESLCESWLRHVKCCQIVQTNWRNSPKWDSYNDGDYQEKVERLFEKVSEHYKLKHPDFEHVFKKNSLQTLLKQSECDNFGIHIEEGKLTAYGIDVVFHRNGAIYSGDMRSDIPRVIKKCVRTAMCILLYTGISEGEIIFASPVMMSTHYDKLMSAIDELKDIMQERGFNFVVRLVANKDFNDEIAEPVAKISRDINDDNELFLRSLQLAEISNSYRHGVPKQNYSNMPNAPDIDLEEIDECMTDEIVLIKDKEFSLYRKSDEKIQDFVRDIFKRLLEMNAIPESELKNLHDKEYCKKTFDLNFALFVDSEAERTVKGRARYSSEQTFFVKGYYICSEWWLGKTTVYDNNIAEWLRKLSTDQTTN